MKTEIKVIGVKLLVSLIDDHTREFNLLKLEFGLDLIEVHTEKTFSIWQYDYLQSSRMFNELIQRHRISLDESVRTFLMRVKNSHRNQPVSIEKSELEETISNQGFIRKLRPFQLRNVVQLLQLDVGASFSVPGAGKTSEILSCFVYKKSLNPKLKLLVICPKNAFSAWDEQISECFEYPLDINRDVKDVSGKSLSGKVARLAGGIANIHFLLQSEPDIMVITFQQLAYSVEITKSIGEFISKNEIFCAVDESHRIKGVSANLFPGTYAQAVLRISTQCVNRYVMSGTPMPQDARDLVNQNSFLFPLSKKDVQLSYDSIQQLYVRTTKNELLAGSELGLSPLRTSYVEVEMSELQRELYSRFKRLEYQELMSSSTRMKVRQLKKSIMRMLQLASNPRIINSESFYEVIRSEGLNHLIEEHSTKFLKACEIARDLIIKGEKVVIWSGFQRNIDLLSHELAEFNPVIVDGRVPSSEDLTISGTRESNIMKFKTDPSVRVFIANPAAASEGISLHIDHEGNRLCSYAIYLDRNFNASQYIQSVDRIHRLGMKDHATIFILKTINSMDQRVQDRLDMKINAMIDLLNDHSLTPYTAIGAVDSEEFDYDSDSQVGMDKTEYDYFMNEFTAS